MLALVALATLVVAQTPTPDAPPAARDYTPQVGDRVVLARDEEGRRVPIVKNAGAAMSFLSTVLGPNEDHYEAIVDGDQLGEADAGTSAQILEAVPTRTPIFGIQILDGRFKGMTVYTYGAFCRRPVGNAAAAPARTKGVRTKKKPPAATVKKPTAAIDKAAIVADVKTALEAADANRLQGDLTAKKKAIRDALTAICKKYAINYIQLNALATQAGVIVTLNGEKYDVAGNRIRK